jgi:hypothetical protein
MFYVDPAATAATTFNAAGTLIGANGASGYTGDLINLLANNVSKFSVGIGGAVVSQATINAVGNYLKGGFAIVTAVPTSITTAQGMGTTPAILGNSSLGFQATVGASPTAGTFTINFATTAARGYACTASDTTTLTNVISQSSFSTTTAVMQNYVRTTGVAGALTASDVIVFQCTAF